VGVNIANTYPYQKVRYQKNPFSTFQGIIMSVNPDLDAPILPLKEGTRFRVVDEEGPIYVIVKTTYNGKSIHITAQIPSQPEWMRSD